MDRRLAVLVGIGLALLGTFASLFFLGVLLIADCSEACWRRGEPVPAILIIVAGALLVAYGVRYSVRAWRS